MLTPEEKVKLDNLFEDYHKLALSHDRLHNRVEAISTLMNECCSVDKLIEREIAHTTLDNLVKKLEKITDSFIEVEKTLSIHTLSNEKLYSMDEKINRLMLYSAMFLGGLAVVEYFGLFK